MGDGSQCSSKRKQRKESEDRQRGQELAAKAGLTYNVRFQSGHAKAKLPCPPGHWAAFTLALGRDSVLRCKACRTPPPRTPWSRQISFGFLLEADQEVTPSMPRWQPGSRKTEPASTSLFGEVIAGIVPGAREKSTAIAPACQARGTSSIMSAAIPPPTP